MTTDLYTALMVGLTMIPVLIVLDFTVGYLTGTGLRARLTAGLKDMTGPAKGQLEVRSPDQVENQK
jgi:hypothetical protein